MNISIQVSGRRALHARTRSARKIAAVVLLALIAAPTLSANEQNQPNEAGQVTLVIGQAIAHNKKGESRPLKRGDSVYVEDVIETAVGGHVHLRFIDDGSLSLRPESRLSIELYHYDRVHPRNSAIRFNLETGVLRSISGKATEAAHDRFRLNTPITAIGVLGTDFVVRAEPDKMWAGVYSGAIAIAPLNDQCSVNGLGACAGATHLSETMGSVMLEFSGGRIKEKIVPRDATILPTAGNSNPNEDKPAESSKTLMSTPERTVDTEKGSKSADATNAASGRMTVAEMKATDVTTRLDAPQSIGQPPVTVLPEPVIPEPVLPEPVLPEPVLPEPVIPEIEIEIPIQPKPDIPVIVLPIPPVPIIPIQPEPVIPTPPAVFAWARWNSAQWAGDRMSEPHSDARSGRTVTVGNKYFALFRTNSDSTQLEPRKGAYDFKLSQGQVHFIPKAPTPWQQEPTTLGRLSAATLHIDFAERQFNTHLEMSHVKAGSTPAIVDVSGTIRDNGIFTGNNATSKVAGALSTEGKQAGMFFEHEVQSGTFQGLTDWIRN